MIILSLVYLYTSRAPPYKAACSVFVVCLAFLRRGLALLSQVPSYPFPYPPHCKHYPCHKS